MRHTVITITWIILSTIFFGLTVILISLLSKDGHLPHRIARIWAESILMVSGVRVKVRGLSNIDPSASYVYMSNHQSNADIPVLLSRLPVQFRWLAKVELFRIPILGEAMKRAGYISIDRSDRNSAIASLKLAARAIRNGVSVMIFPEGTRSKDGSIGPFKKGGFVMAIDSGVPIVPVILHGTKDIMPKKKLTIKPGNVVLEIRPPVETESYKQKNKTALMNNIRSIICGAFENSQ